MIIYTIDGEKNEGVKNVKVNMIVDDDGDLRINVNGVTIGWFATNGTFNRVILSPLEQNKCGMQVDETDRLKVNDYKR